jgi:hypothetical protein
LDPEEQVNLLLRALTFDRALDERVGDTLRVLVLCDADEKASVRQALAILDALDARARKGRVAGRVLRASLFAYTSPESLLLQLKSFRGSALYLSPGLEEHLAEILEVSRAQRVATLAGIDDYVFDGASVGVLERHRRPLLINLPASRAEGIRFDHRLLRLAEVIE